jgi:SpoVK/Ycf46/Vps4 family AAA+-type ATPase
MERFKGLAILATNRKKDLDEAFLRRLRYIVEFPFPEIEERKRIWRQVIPGNVDSSDVDVNFLARKFQLSGGHIRSALLNACLQCASEDGAAKAVGDRGPKAKDAKKKEGTFKGVLTMEQLIIAVKREYDKMERTVSPEHFGPYSGIIEKIEKNDEKQ